MESIKERKREPERVITLDLKKTLLKVSVLFEPLATVSINRSFFRALTKALRIYQWVKNVLLFVPFLLAHRALNGHVAGILVGVWFSFSLCTSSGYVINDIMDLESDRRHPKKRYRPFASGELNIFTGVLLSVCAMALSVTTAILLLKKQSFLIMIGLYWITSLLYSFRLKKLLFADVLILAGLYTLRIFAGGLVLDIPISNWLLAFALFFFTSLALLKRYSELHFEEKGKQSYDNRRYYEMNDLNLLQTIGVGTGLLSILVLVLYLKDDTVISNYSHPEWLWLTAPPLLYWINRMWFLAGRGIVKDDPVVFSVKDKMSYMIAGLIMLVFIFSSYL